MAAGRVDRLRVLGRFEKQTLNHLSSFSVKKELLQWIKRFLLLIRKPYQLEIQINIRRLLIYSRCSGNH